MGSTNKGRWYRFLIDQLDNAIKNGFYLEALFVEYMIIDDRMKSLAEIANISLLKDDDSPKMIGQLIDDIKKAKKNPICSRWNLLEEGIPLAPKETLVQMKKEKYPQELICKCIHVPACLISYERSAKSGKYLPKYGDSNSSILEQIKVWTNYRNHLMHGAGNDCLSLAEYENEVIPLAIDGASFVRTMCANVMKIKRCKNRETKTK